MKIPVFVLPQISDEAWQRMTVPRGDPKEDPSEDPIERILRENQLDMMEVLNHAESA